MTLSLSCVQSSLYDFLPRRLKDEQMKNSHMAGESLIRFYVMNCAECQMRMSNYV